MHYEIHGRDQVRFLQLNNDIGENSDKIYTFFAHWYFGILLEIELDSSANNRDLYNNQESQKLSMDDINKLKAKSLGGELAHQTLIKEIVANSSTFESKTSYAKQKYIKRKEKKLSWWRGGVCCCWWFWDWFLS